MQLLDLALAVAHLVLVLVLELEELLLGLYDLLLLDGLPFGLGLLEHLLPALLEQAVEHGEDHGPAGHEAHQGPDQQ